jgi:Tol biopolymer transport system component
VPSGDHIAALGWPAPQTQNAVVVIPASGGEPRRLTPAEEREYKEGLEWHPDGRRLTYMYYENGGGDGTRVAYVDGRPTELLVNQPDPLWDYVGLWEPAGRRYYFTASSFGIWGLHAYDETTGTASVVVHDATTGHAGNVALPSFSRDGQIMAYPVQRSTRQLWVMEIGR